MHQGLLDLGPYVIVLTVLGVVSFLIWSALAYFNRDLQADYAKFVISVTVGIVGLVLRDMGTPDAPATPPPAPPLALPPAPGP